MPPPAFRRLEDLFHRALALPPEQRSSFLDGACAGNAALRAAVQDLLEHDGGPGTESFLESPVPRGTEGPGETVPAGEAVPAGEDRPQIPGYEILGELGRGGMGVVYEARQQSLNRVVALKMLLPAAAVSADRLARFRAEAEVLARLQHPNVVPVYEVGEHDGRPYFTMACVAGPSLAQVLEGKPQDVAASARLVEVLARAVDDVHKAGIIHRDLKPANILLGRKNQVPRTKNQVPDAGFLDLGSWIFSPQVSDFGLARDQASGRRLTQSGTAMGTPSYMAPEQAHGDRDVGPAADIYSLGAILYEMLTGRPPFDGVTVPETIAQLLRDEPLPPSRLRRGLPRDLDTICLKCLEKAPRRRYASAGELAEELRRFQAGEPIRARPPGPAERLYRWCRRRPLVAGLAALSSALAVALIVSLFLYQAHLTEALAATAEEQRQHIVRLNVTIGVIKADEGNACDAVLRFAEALRLDEIRPPTSPNHRVRIGTTLRLCPRLLRLETLGGRVLCTQLGPSGAWAVTAGEDRSVLRVWDVLTDRPAGPPLKQEGPPRTAAVSAGGRSLAVVQADGSVRLWDVPAGKPGGLIKTAEAVRAVGFEPAGRILITRHADAAVRLWDVTAGKPAALPGAYSRDTAFAVTSNDNRWLFTVNREHGGQVYDVTTGKAAGPPLQLKQAPAHAAISPDGRRLALLDADGTLRVREASGGRWLGEPIKPGVGVTRLAFSPDGSQILTAGTGRGVQLWQVGKGALLCEFPARPGEVRQVGFSPDGRRVVTARAVAGDRVWDVASGQAVTPPLPHGGAPAAALTAAGQFVTVGRDGTACVWELPRTPGLNAEPLPGGPPEEKTRVDLGGRTIRLADGTPVRVKRAETGAALAPPRPADGILEHAAFSPSGDRLVAADPDGTARVWDVASGKPMTPPLRHQAAVVYAAFSADGGRLLTASKDRTARVWDVARGEALSPPLRHARDIRRALFSPDGSRAVVVCAGDAVATWDLTPDARPADELLLLAEVLSCGRIDERQTRQPLDAGALRSAWERLPASR
jgi:serine/threonine protein kinase/WD40 repeat protein